MIELHAWATIRESYNPEDEEDNLDEIVLQLQNYQKERAWESDLFIIEYYNGVPNLSIALYKNRKGIEVDEVFELFGLISEIAKGSYGLIYLYDDEDSEGQENEFQIYRLIKGRLEKKMDMLLSPVVPTIEDI